MSGLHSGLQHGLLVKTFIVLRTNHFYLISILVFQNSFCARGDISWGGVVAVEFTNRFPERHSASQTGRIVFEKSSLLWQHWQHWQGRKIASRGTRGAFAKAWIQVVKRERTSHQLARKLIDIFRWFYPFLWSCQIEDTLQALALWLFTDTSWRPAFQSDRFVITRSEAFPVWFLDFRFRVGRLPTCCCYFAGMLFQLYLGSIAKNALNPGSFLRKNEASHIKTRHCRTWIKQDRKTCSIARFFEHVSLSWSSWSLEAVWDDRCRGTSSPVDLRQVRSCDNVTTCYNVEYNVVLCHA